MFEKIKSVKISGMCFGDTHPPLELFPNESQRVSIIYGKNGSGKSTFAKAFKNYSEYSETTELCLDMLDYRNSVMLSKTNSDSYFGSRERIYVFNEEYVMKKVGFKDNGLETIVLFDKQNQLEEEIDITNEKLNEIKERRNQINTSIELNNKELMKTKKEIEKALKSDWAAKDANIKHNKANSSVNEAIINEIYSINSNQTISELQKQFDVLFNKYQLLSDQKVSYPTIKNISNYSREKEQFLISALSKKLQKISVDDKDQFILEKLQENLNHTNDLRNVLKESNALCPFCYQAIDGEYKETLLKIIKIVLNSDVKEHTFELDKMKISPYLFDVTPYESLDEIQCSRIKKQIDVINSIISKYNEAIEEKKESIYTPLIIDSLNLSNEIIVLHEMIQHLSNLREEYYKSFEDIDQIKEDLILLNKKIAHKNYEAKLETYFKYKKQSNDDNLALKECDAQIVIQEEYLEKIEADKKNVKVPVKYMNYALEYIFFAKDRMTIDFKDGSYIIKSKKANVKPVCVSCGERNIIALCYFFSEMMEGLKESELYTRESLIILDDPVSSFDYDNRIGIISYLKQQTSKILTHNPNSRIVFLSHDLYTVDSIYKFVGEIRDKFAISESGIPKIGKYCYLCSFSNLNLIPEDTENRMHVYSKLLKSVYDFALGKETDKYEFSIGNLMRRLLEAFGTFEYQKGIIDLSFDPNLQERIPEEKRQFFENLMYRLILHEESHSEDHISSSDVDFYIKNTLEEKIQTAKYILCLIYALNPLHLKMRFKLNEMKDCQDAIINIKKWYDEIAIK